MKGYNEMARNFSINYGRNEKSTGQKEFIVL
jgi:hypothetical protein